MRRNKAARRTNVAVRRSIDWGYGEGDRIRTMKWGAENCVQEEGDRGRNGEKTDICSAPAAKL